MTQLQFDFMTKAKQECGAPQGVPPHRWNAFLHFHGKNPDLLDFFIEKARAMKATGRHRHGIADFWEDERWHHAVVQRVPGFRFKLDNNLRPLYARAIMLRAPDLAGFFVVRSMGPRGRGGKK